MTLLEYLLTQYLGNAIRVKGNGESYWPCPHCSSNKFHTMPTHQVYRHRAKCWSCDLRGDAADMLKEFHPNEPYDERLQRLEQLTKEWQAQERVRNREVAGERGVPKPSVRSKGK
jgi:hypothetical protein